MREGKKIYRHGNLAKVDPQDSKGDVPDFLAYMPTQADVHREGRPDEIDDTKVYLSKKEVDDNHK